MAGITITLVFSENGIIEKAKDAGDVTKKVDIIEDIQLDILEKEIENSGEGISLSELEEILDKHSEKVNKDEDGNITSIEVEGLSNPIDIKEIYTGKLRSEETVDIKTILQVGDFIDYHAGIWTAEDIAKLGSLYADGGELPTSALLFGGFKVNETSKDESINTNPKWNSTKKGWRVLSIEDNKINLVHAGNPEGFYYDVYPGNPNNGGEWRLFAGEYILNYKTTSSYIPDTVKENVTEYRDWSMYEKGDLVIPGSAHTITYEEAFSITGDDDPTDSVRNTGASYWLPKYCDERGGYLTGVMPDGSMKRTRAMIKDCMAIRPVISIRSNVKVVSGEGSEDKPYELQLVY